MPSLLGQLNCFSKKTRRRRRRHGEDGDDDEHKQPLVSPGGSNSTSPTSSRTSPGSKASKGSKASRGSKQSSKPSLTLNHRMPRHDEDDSIPTFDSGYRNIKSSNFSVSDAGGTTGTPGKSLSGFSQSAAGFGSPAGAFGSVAGGEDSLERKLYDAYPSNLIQSPVQRRKEEMIEVHAPKGKLGLVVDAPDDALTPVVHAVKDSCPIRDEICVGDRLVAVDDVDVREMTAVEVSRLLSRKSGQARRKLTIIRTSR